MNKKIAIINQRYGLEVNGGSELYTREIAEHLNEKYEVEVLTTCALDYVTWENYYKEGVEVINGVNVRRFQSAQERNQKKFTSLTEKVLWGRKPTIHQYEEWIDEQGPKSPELINYIEKNQDKYDVFIVVTYLYYPAVRSLSKIGHKAIFIPTAHQEPYIHFTPYEAVFLQPKAYVFLTDEEKELVWKKFGIQNKPYEVMGVGVDIPKKVDEKGFKERHHLDEYLIYVGRIDNGKNCSCMFDYFIEYKKRNPGNFKLVLMGKKIIEIPKHKDIINLGFVSEEDKFSGIKGAKALVLPSKFESLSISVLEAMSLRTPVIVNGRCDVLKSHCVKSNGGLYYLNYFEFEGCVNYIKENLTEYEIMRDNARKYIDTYYRWDVIMKKFDRIIEIIS